MMRLRDLVLVGLFASGAACEQAPAPAKPAPAQPDAPAPAPAPTPTDAPSTDAEPAVPAPLPVAGEVAYVERILGGAKATDPLPMIVAIHGLGDAPDNFAHLFDTFPEPARLILPRGIDPFEEGGYSWFPLRARDPDVDALSDGIASAADKVAVAIGQLAKERPTKGTPILTGFSQGGMLSFAVAVRHPEVIAAAFPVGGWLPPPLMPDAGPPADAPPIDAFNGTDDRAVAFEPTKAAVASLSALGWKAQLHAYEGVGHAITPEIHRDLTDGISSLVRDAADD